MKVQRSERLRDELLGFGVVLHCVTRRGCSIKEEEEERSERESEPESCTVIANLDHICYFILHQDCSDWETLEKWKGEEEMYEFLRQWKMNKTRVSVSNPPIERRDKGLLSTHVGERFRHG